MSGLTSKGNIRNGIILILICAAGFAALANLYTNFHNQADLDRAAYLEENLAKAAQEFKEEVDRFDLLVSGIRSFNYNSEDLIGANLNHLFLKRFLRDSEYQNPVISSFLDTSHTFIYSVSNNEVNPNELVGARLTEFRSDLELKGLDQIMLSDQLVAMPPFNMTEGFPGLPINFGLVINGQVLGYIATILDIRNLIEPVLAKDVNNEFTFKFIYGDDLEFDREIVHDGLNVFHERTDTSNLSLAKDHYNWTNIDAFRASFKIGIAYKNKEASNKILTFLDRTSAIVGALLFLLALMIYLFLQQVSNTKLIRESRNTTEAMNNVLKKFISAVSYDLKKPIDNVHKQIEYLKKNRVDELDEETRNRLRIIDQNSIRMESLMDDFLSYAEVIRHDEIQEIVDLNILIQEIQSFYSEDNVDILSEPLPIVTGNKAQLDKLFRQLISNGIKFNQRERPRIVISSSYFKDRILVQVSDDGIGIKPEYLKTIFEDFHRLDADHYTGTGLGLAICKEIVKNHGGKIIAQNNDSGGTDIIFFLPAQENPLTSTNRSN